MPCSQTAVLREGREAGMCRAGPFCVLQRDSGSYRALRPQPGPLRSSVPGPLRAWRRR